MRKIYVFLFLFLVEWGFAQTTDFKHLMLSVRLDTNEREVTGTVALTFDYKPSKEGEKDSIYLNGIKMNYRMASLNGEKAEFNYNESGIWFTPEKGVLRTKENVIVIHYNCNPLRGIFFVGWDDETGLSKRQIWTQGQGIDHRHWIPYKDDQTDKLTTEMIITFDSSYQVVSNGDLLLKSPNQYNPGETVWHFGMKNPHPGYLMMIGIGKYANKQTQSKSGIPLTQYYYPEREEDYPWYYYKNEQIFNFMEREIGVPFPWVNYKQVPVQDFQHGAMENTTATIFGDFFMVDEHAFNDRNYTYVNAHELAHQWFGNLVTAESSDHHWLHEGFATYYQWLSEKHLYGQDFFDWERYKAAQLVFEASKMDTVPLGNGKAGSSRFYQKGAWVLYMLNQELGHETFRKVVKHYLENNMFGVVNTETFNKSIKKVTGKDYTQFFEQWVFTAGEPVAEIDVTLGENAVTPVVVPYYNPFGHFRLKVLFTSKDGKTLIRPLVFEDSVTQKVLDSLGVDLKNVMFWTSNANMAMLAQVEETKPLEMWLAQYEGSKALLDRYFAIKALRDFDLKEKEKTLISAFENEKEFFSVRAEALSQLIEGEHKKADKFLLEALQSKDIQLQKEAIKLAKDPTEEQLAIIADLRKGNSYELRENAIHRSIDPKNPEANQWLMDSALYVEPGFPGNNVAITALLYRSAFLGDKAALEELKAYTSSGYDFMTRTKAMDALSALKYFDTALAANYFDAVFNLNRTLAREARGHLKVYYQNQEYKNMIDAYINENQKQFSDFEKRLVNLTFGLNLE
jgi:aminopeptidase N